MLRSIYNQCQQLEDPKLDAVARQDFVFHMTDWIDDLEQLAALYADPEKFDKAAARQAVYDILIHALPHLLAASRLLLGKVLDPFADWKLEDSLPLKPVPRPRRRPRVSP